jgi:hypothetical protein
MNGIPVEDQPDFGGTACTTNVWCELEVRWKEGVTTVKVNGQGFFQPLSQPEFTTGKVGLVTHAAVGRFDKVFVGVPFGDQPFLETFDGPPSVTFTPQSGQWSVVNGSEVELQNEANFTSVRVNGKVLFDRIGQANSPAAHGRRRRAHHALGTWPVRQRRVRSRCLRALHTDICRSDS